MHTNSLVSKPREVVVRVRQVLGERSAPVWSHLRYIHVVLEVHLINQPRDCRIVECLLKQRKLNGWSI